MLLFKPFLFALTRPTPDAATEAPQWIYRKNSSLFKHESGINTGDPITELFALPGPLQLLFRQRHILGVRRWTDMSAGHVVTENSVTVIVKGLGSGYSS